jgi:hypothetical protein
VGPDIGASLTANLTDEPRFNVGQSNVVLPLVGRHRDRVATPIVRTINQDAPNAAGAHFPEGEAIARSIGQIINPLGMGTAAIYCASGAGSLIPPRRILPGNGEVGDVFTHLDETQIN